MSKAPLIGITMGDPAGIGPEIITKALSDETLYPICRPVVLGDAGALRTSLKYSPAMSIKEISNTSDAKGKAGQIDILPLSNLEEQCLIPGKPCSEGGRAMGQYIIRAVELAKQGELAAVVTCPISKALLHTAGHVFEGHTQMIAELTNTDDYVMMLAGDRLRVALVTIHCALADVPGRLNEDEIYKTILITYKALEQDFGFSGPRIAVTSLNPHAGESGLFGSEEETMIKPAVERARSEGCSVEGPFPADTLFHQAASGRFEAVVAMYHDQGLIPLKLLHFSNAVNITLGLPIVRTSVDHGTAYDIAGKGTADPSSLVAAIHMAVRIAKNRASR
ncbi:4-hydroxythreonine-4-phosphate dehydrogenase PdxA [Thermodesulfobacteriota bacterium]